MSHSTSYRGSKYDTKNTILKNMMLNNMMLNNMMLNDVIYPMFYTT